MTQENALTGTGNVQPIVELPVSIDGRNRLTVAFRPILAIPHLIFIGGFQAGWNGVLGAVAAVCALISWFTLLFTGRQPDGLASLIAFYLRWRVRGIGYFALLRDEYPPFGEGDYPLDITLPQPTEPRDRVSIGFRILLVIPHLILLVFLLVAWIFTTIIAWFAILFTGRYPVGLANFAVGVLRWGIRVEAYLLLTHDNYPPFSLNE